MNTQQITDKINLIRASRTLVGNGMAAHHFPLSTEAAEMNQTLRDMIFAYLKVKFPSCKIRTGESVISIRLDAEVHKKARKLREAVLQNPEWKRWFDENHRDITRTLEIANNIFQSESYLEYKVLDDKHYIHIPFESNRIRNFAQEGVLRFFAWIEGECSKDRNAANIYDRTVLLMETEVRRREEARRARIERERNDYLTGLRKRLTPAIRLSDFDRSGITAEDKFKAKMYDWCTEQGIDPTYAIEMTAQEMLPIGTNVRIVSREGSREEDWFVVPMFGGYELPESYMLKDRWGKVTDHNTTDTRSRGGTASVVVEGFIFAQFNIDFWHQTIPENHAVLWEQSKRVSLEAEVEAEEAHLAREEEAARVRAQQEATRALELEQRRAELRAKLEQQRSEPKVEVQHKPSLTEIFETQPVYKKPIPKHEGYSDSVAEDVELPAPVERTPQEIALSDSIRKQLTKKSDDLVAQLEGLSHSQNVYRNERGLTIERFIAVSSNGTKRFFRTEDEAVNCMLHEYGVRREDVQYLYDYWNPRQRIQRL